MQPGPPSDKESKKNLSSAQADSFSNLRPRILDSTKLIEDKINFITKEKLTSPQKKQADFEKLLQAYETHPVYHDLIEQYKKLSNPQQRIDALNVLKGKLEQNNKPEYVKEAFKEEFTSYQNKLITTHLMGEIQMAIVDGKKTTDGKILNPIWNTEEWKKALDSRGETRQEYIKELGKFIEENFKEDIKNNRKEIISSYKNLYNHFIQAAQKSGVSISLLERFEKFMELRQKIKEKEKEIKQIEKEPSLYFLKYAEEAILKNQRINELIEKRTQEEKRIQEARKKAKLEQPQETAQEQVKVEIAPSLSAESTSIEKNDNKQPSLEENPLDLQMSTGLAAEGPAEEEKNEQAEGLEVKSQEDIQPPIIEATLESQETNAPASSEASPQEKSEAAPIPTPADESKQEYSGNATVYVVSVSKYDTAEDHLNQIFKGGRLMKEEHPMGEPNSLRYFNTLEEAQIEANSRITETAGLPQKRQVKPEHVKIVDITLPEAYRKKVKQYYDGKDGILPKATYTYKEDSATKLTGSGKTTVIPGTSKTPDPVSSTKLTGRAKTTAIPNTLKTPDAASFTNSEKFQAKSSLISQAFSALKRMVSTFFNQLAPKNKKEEAPSSTINSKISSSNMSSVSSTAPINEKINLSTPPAVNTVAQAPAARSTSIHNSSPSLPKKDLKEEFKEVLTKYAEQKGLTDELINAKVVSKVNKGGETQIELILPPKTPKEVLKNIKKDLKDSQDRKEVRHNKKGKKKTVAVKQSYISPTEKDILNVKNAAATANTDWKASYQTHKNGWPKVKESATDPLTNASASAQNTPPQASQTTSWQERRAPFQPTQQQPSASSIASKHQAEKPQVSHETPTPPKPGGHRKPS